MPRLASLLLLSFGCLVFARPASVAAQDWRVREPVVGDRTMTQWIARLKSVNVEFRREAVEVLAHLSQHTKAVVPHLIAAARDPDPQTRAAAIAAHLPRTDEALKLVDELLNDPESTVRYNAYTAAIRLSDDGKPPCLLKALYESDINFHELAVQTLYRTKPQLPGLLPALFNAWTYQDHNLPSNLTELIVTQPGAAAFLLEATWSPEAHVRKRAFPLCVRAIPESDWPLLFRRALNDRDNGVRAAAFQYAAYAAKWDCREEFVLQAAIAGLEDPNPEIRWWARFSLQSLRPFSSNSIPLLMDLTRHREEDIRVAALSAIGNFAAADESVLLPLLPLLDDPSPGIRLHTCAAIGAAQSTNPKIYRALLKALEDDDDIVRMVAVRYVGEFDRSRLDPASLDATISALLRLIHEHPGIGMDLTRPHNRFWLQRFDPEGTRSIPHLVDWIQTERQFASHWMGQLSQFGKAGANTIAALAKDPDATIASHAIEFLHNDEPSHLAIIDAALKSNDAERRKAALHRLCCRGAIELALVNDVAACVNNPDQEIRLLAMQVFPHFDRTAVVYRSLASGLSDPDEQVRAAALQSIGRMDAAPEKFIDILADLSQAEDQNGFCTLLVLLKLNPRSNRGAQAVIRKISYSRDNAQLEQWLPLVSEFEVRRDEIALALLERLEREIREAGDGDLSLLVNTLASLGPAADIAVPTFMDLACDWQAPIRLAAIQALGEVGPGASSAIPLLTARLDDDDPNVAEAACVALAKIHRP